ncbi:MAG: type II toxin-antitoxin system RelE/ParE family toxin [Deltaproteobacteria bacterium]|nr:MAG: type II toxin-antitoxin system RelE/ParE family toxin [Deltaproteobacteria bacterium]
MTKHFSKWAKRQNIHKLEIQKALNEVENGVYEADLGGHIIKKRIRFPNRGKSGSGRVIICYKYGDRAIFLHGFAKNDKGNLSSKELHALKEFGKVLLLLSENKLNAAIINGDLIEV